MGRTPIVRERPAVLEVLQELRSVRNIPPFFLAVLGVYVNILIDRSGYSTFDSLDEMDV